MNFKTSIIDELTLVYERKGQSWSNMLEEYHPFRENENKNEMDLLLIYMID